ncbi:MAG: ATP-dependent helicase/nuclease subunit A [Phycisphaerae bacterium]|nr:ATP-dependent helicase/nuclease subunit A [Phycisphaerae bacterium]
MSVSELKRLFDTRAEADEAVPQAMTPRTWRRDERAPWDRRDDASALARGTATHTLLQRLDLSGPLEQAGEIRRQAERMAEEGVFTLRQPGSAPGKKTSKASRAGLADLVDVEAVAAFFAGDVGRLIRASRDRVRREWAFSMAMDAGDVLRLTGGPGAAASADGDFVLVQGIIDLLCELEDGSLLVLDYKTDAVRTEEQLADRVAGYRGQVALYARAAELILARPVSRRCLYFLRPRRLVELE